MPSFGPRTAQVRLDPELARLDLAERHVAHAELVRDLVGVALRPRRALDDERAQRLAQLDARGRTSLPPELDHAAELRDLGEELDVGLAAASGQPARCTESGASSHGCGQHPPQMVGEERHERRDHAEALDERVPERAQGHCVAVPEPAPRAADVPVRDVVDERLVRTNDVEREPALVPGGRLAHQCVRPLDEPAVERLELAARVRARGRSTAGDQLPTFA